MTVTGQPSYFLNRMKIPIIAAIAHMAMIAALMEWGWGTFTYPLRLSTRVLSCPS